MSSAAKTARPPASLARQIAISFAAGAGAMALAATLPQATHAAISFSTAEAATAGRSAPAVASVDVTAIQAQIDQAQRSMNTMRSATDEAIGRLERLSGR